MSSVTRRYRGVLAEHSHGEADDILFLDGADTCGDPLAEQIRDDAKAHGHYLTVRYWTASARRNDDAMIEGALRVMLGEAETQYRHCYSETTGYLWTDEEVNVGGHHLLEELRSDLGRYCLLEIEYSTEPTQPLLARSKAGTATHNMATTPGELLVHLWGTLEGEPEREVRMTFTETDIKALIRYLRLYALL